MFLGPTFNKTDTPYYFDISGDTATASIVIKSHLAEKHVHLLKNQRGIIRFDGFTDVLQPILFQSVNAVFDKLIGSGKRGKVYMLDSDKVVKVQPTDARVYAEVDAMVHLPISHHLTNLVRVISDATTTYEIMNYGGKPLVLPIAAADAEPLFNGIMAGLNVIHAAGYIHGDLHPENILMGSYGAVITDFGTMQRLGADGFYRGPARGGRWDSMPPEQFGREVVLSPASDIYSAASTVLWCLLGRAPFAPVPGDVSRSHESIEKMLKPFALSNDFKAKIIKALSR